MHTLYRIAAATLTAIIANLASAGDRQWYVSVNGGENYEVIVAASDKQSLSVGSYLADSFSGKQIYLRLADNYSLEQYRPPSRNTSQSESAAVTAAADVATSTADKPATREAFYIVDGGVTSFADGDFKGWYCTQRLKVTPLGNKDYLLGCPQRMTRQ